MRQDILPPAGRLSHLAESRVLHLSPRAGRGAEPGSRPNAITSPQGEGYLGASHTHERHPWMTRSGVVGIVQANLPVTSLKSARPRPGETTMTILKKTIAPIL